MPSKTDRINGSNDSPFYSTETWFTELNKQVFSDCDRIDYYFSTLQLPHIITTEKFLFLKLKQLKSLSNYYTPEFIPVGLVNTDKENNIFRFYNQQEINAFDCIEINPISENNADNLVSHLSDCGFFCEKYKITTNWTHPLITSKIDFWDERPTKLKNTLKTKKSKMDRREGFMLEILCDDNEDKYKKLIQDYHDVYKKSWKNDEPFNEFINKITLDELKKEKLRLGVIYHENIAVAAQIWFVHSKTAYIFKLSYDNNYRTESVGSILMEAMFNHVIDKDKVTTIDFLTGDDPYKADWMSESRPLFGVKAYNKSSFKGLVATFAIQLNKIIKKTLKPGH